MTSAMTIFGIALATLFSAIAQVESDNGLTSDNVYQLSDIYIKDVNRYYGGGKYATTDKFDRKKSEQIMLEYLALYGRRYYIKTGMKPTAETLARIHNGGPDGWRKPATLGYWRKVQKAMEERE